MHYTRGGSPILPLSRGRGFDDLVDEVVERVPADSYVEDGVSAPFLDSSDPWVIASECLPHCTGAPRTDAVYILECFQNSSYLKTRGRYIPNSGAPWERDLGGEERLLYVGMTVNLLRRLDQHLNSIGDEGAHFTTVFRPTRVLDVSWWSSFDEALRAEKQIADTLQQRFPEDFVYQS